MPPLSLADPQRCLEIVTLNNLRDPYIDENGFQMQIRLCGKCIKRIKKDTIEGKRPFVKLIHINPPVKKVSESIDVPAVAA